MQNKYQPLKKCDSSNDIIPRWQGIHDVSSYYVALSKVIGRAHVELNMFYMVGGCNDGCKGGMTPGCVFKSSPGCVYKSSPGCAGVLRRDS